jgi:integrase
MPAGARVNPLQGGTTMRVPTLTARSIEKLPAPKVGKVEYLDGSVPGGSFGLRKWPTQRAIFFVYYRFEGTLRQAVLGSFPTTSPEAARKRAAKVLNAAHAGTDPNPRSKVGTATVAALAQHLFAKLGLKPKTRREWERISTVEIIPMFGEKPAIDVTRGEVREWLDRIVERGSPYMANRAWEVLRRMYTFAIERDRISAYPFVGFRPPAEEEASDRVLSTTELVAVLDALDETRDIHPGYSDAALLLLLTGVRREMVRGMTRRELDDLDGREPRWIVPGGFEGRSKSGRTHVVPLSRQALDIVRGRLQLSQGECLFPVARRGTLDRGLDAPMDWSSRFVLDLREAANAAFGSKMPRWTIHGFRHTIGTHMREDLKVPSDVVSLILGHKVSGPAVTRIYNRAELLPERRAALSRWADWLDRIKAKPERGRKRAS